MIYGAGTREVRYFIKSGEIGSYYLEVEVVKEEVERMLESKRDNSPPRKMGY